MIMKDSVSDSEFFNSIKDYIQMIKNVGEKKRKKYLKKKSKYGNSCLCPPDSDDSDNEGGLGNVERVVMRPPGQLVRWGSHFF